MPTFGSLFAGIGGIDLGLERAGWECRFQVEWDPFCQRVLAKHWPDVPRFGDIYDVHGSLAHAESREGGRVQLAGVSPDAGTGGAECRDCLPSVDLLAGGFPCQPFSVAGRQRGMDDDRWLWPEFARAIRELRPRFVLVENVPGLLADTGGMGTILGDLADLGYDAEWESIPAAAVGAPHLRYRVWIVAYATGDRRPEGGARGHVGRDAATADGRREAELVGSGTGGTALADADDLGRDGWTGELRPGWGREPADGGGRRAQSGLGRAPDGFSEGLDGPWADGWEEGTPRVAHGVPQRVDRLRSLGNAVVPQVVEWIGRRLYEEAIG